MISQDDFLDFLSESSSTRADDFISMRLSPWNEDLMLTCEPIPEEPDHMKCLCKICSKNTVSVFTEASSSRKRRKLDTDILPSSSLICEDCLSLSPEQVNSLTDCPEKSLLILKRAQAKRKTEESQALKRLKEDQEKVLAKAQELPANDQQKLKQKMRNRVSAQQSRDRKKAYTEELEAENKLLHQEVNRLKERVSALEQENARLRHQTARQAFSSESRFPQMASVSLALGVILAVCVAVSVFQPVPNLSLKPIGRKLMSINSELDFSSAYQPDSTEANAHALAIPDYQMQSFRRPHSSSVKSSFLPKQNPCDHSWALDEDLPDTVTTLFCPTVQAYISEDIEELSYIQLLTPLESLPLLSKSPEDDLMGQNYFVEILCRVTDVNLVPFSTAF